jgi:hypothetical protein
VNVKLERVWKETVVVSFKVLSQRLCYGLSKTTKTVEITGLQLEIP